MADINAEIQAAVNAENRKQLINTIFITLLQEYAGYFSNHEAGKEYSDDVTNLSAKAVEIADIHMDFVQKVLDDEMVVNETRELRLFPGGLDTLVPGGTKERREDGQYSKDYTAVDVAPNPESLRETSSPNANDSMLRTVYYKLSWQVDKKDLQKLWSEIQSRVTKYNVASAADLGAWGGIYRDIIITVGKKMNRKFSY